MILALYYSVLVVSLMVVVISNKTSAHFPGFNVNALTNPLQSVWSVQLSRRPTGEERQSNGHIFKTLHKKNKMKTCP